MSQTLQRNNDGLVVYRVVFTYDGKNTGCYDEFNQASANISHWMKNKRDLLISQGFRNITYEAKALTEVN